MIDIISWNWPKAFSEYGKKSNETTDFGYFRHSERLYVKENDLLKDKFNHYELMYACMEILNKELVMLLAHCWPFNVSYIDHEICR